MAIFEGVDRNRNIIIAVAVVVVILVIVYWLYAAGFVSIEVTDATGHCLGGFRSLGGRGAPRRAHEIIAKPCRGRDLQAVGRLFRLELQDLSACLSAQAVLSATMGTVFTFLLPYEYGPSFIFYDG